MKVPVVLTLLTCVAITARSNAADPPAAPTTPPALDATAKPSAEKRLGLKLPKCDIKFLASTGPLEVSVNDSNLEGIDNRFVATFRMDLPVPSGGNGVQQDDGVNYPMWSNTEIQDFPQVPGLVDLYYGSPPSSNGREWSRNEIIHSVGRMPAKDRPPNDLIAAIKASSLSVARLERGNLGASYYSVAVSIYGATQDDAKRLASEFIRLYEVGLAIPEQTDCIGGIRDLTNLASESIAKLAPLDARLPAMQKESDSLNEYKDIDATAMATYVAQRRLLDVDAAGTKARVDACNQILGRKNAPALSNSQVEHVEGVKIAAEVELAGLVAKRNAIVLIIQNGKRRLELLGKLKADSNERESLSGRVNRVEQTHRDELGRLAEWQKCPVQDGKVLIQPVKWVAGKQK